MVVVYIFKFTDFSLMQMLLDVYATVPIQFPGGSIRILQTAQKDCSPVGVQSSKYKDGDKDIPVILNRRKDDDKLDLFQSSQAEWIKQYVEQQEEVREEVWLMLPLPFSFQF